jgi:hypothetical protein
MRLVLDSVITENQSAFVSGRHILDNILIANEVASYLKSTGLKGFMFKVDFEKAYDSVSWEFIQSIMSLMGFSET